MMNYSCMFYIIKIINDEMRWNINNPMKTRFDDEYDVMVWDEMGWDGMRWDGMAHGTQFRA